MVKEILPIKRAKPCTLNRAIESADFSVPEKNNEYEKFVKCLFCTSKKYFSIKNNEYRPKMYFFEVKRGICTIFRTRYFFPGIKNQLQRLHGSPMPLWLSLLVKSLWHGGRVAPPDPSPCQRPKYI